MDKTKLTAFGERLKIGGERLKIGSAEIGRKVGDKMKEILQVQSQEAKMVDEATSDSLEGPNWGLNLRICNLLNNEEFDGSEVVRAIKKRISCNDATCQRLSLDLLETCAMNCDKVFSEVASEKVLDEMVKMIDNPQKDYDNRQRALQLIKAWGNSEDLGYLPIFKQTYMSVKDKKIVDNDRSSPSAFEPDVYEQAGVPPEYPFLTSSRPNPYLASHGGHPSVEEKKEILATARNSIEILSSLLNTETQLKPVRDDLMLTMVENCKESQPVIQRIIESIGNDETLMFEALNLHDELEVVLSKYEALKLVDPAPNALMTGNAPVALSPKGIPPVEKEEQEEQTNLGGTRREVGTENRNTEKKE